MSVSNLFFQDCGVAEVKETITPESVGQIFFQSTFWLARCVDRTSAQTFPPGTAVQVVGREGLIQLIRSV